MADFKLIEEKKETPSPSRLETIKEWIRNRKFQLSFATLVIIALVVILTLNGRQQSHLHAKIDGLEKAYSGLKEAHSDLADSHSRLQDAHSNLNDAHSDLKVAHSDLKNRVNFYSNAAAASEKEFHLEVKGSLKSLGENFTLVKTTMITSSPKLIPDFSAIICH